MKNISLPSSLLLLVSIAVFNQTYEEDILSANELNAEGRYMESSGFWDKAFLIHERYTSEYCNASCPSARTGETDKASLTD